MLLAHDIGAEDLGEQLEFGLAGRRRARCDVVDGAVVLAQPDGAVGAERGVGQITLIALDDGQLADPVEQRRLGGNPLGHLLADPVAELAPSRREDLLQEVVPADRRDRGQQTSRQAVVVGREEVLGFGRDVVQVARPADAVADGLTADQVGSLQRPELLEDAGPAGADPFGELVR